MAILSELPEYVDSNRDKLLKESVMQCESAKLFTLQVGCKTKTAINLLNTDIVWQDASSCGWNAQGDSKITQRTITAAPIKINTSFCAKTLLDSALQHQVRMTAGLENLPFAETFCQSIIDKVNESLDVLIWQGDTDKSSDANLKWTDGVIKLLKASDGITEEGQKLTHDAPATDKPVYQMIDDVILALPAQILKRAQVFLGWDYFRRYMLEMKNLNLFHFAPEDLETGVINYPGSVIKIHALHGLTGTGEIVAGDPKNFYFGTGDFGSDNTFDLWYSKDNDEHRFKLETQIGTQIAFPNEVVISSLAGA